MTPIIPRGKGVLLWQLDNCKPQPMSSLVGALDLNGFDWAAPKIADGILRYNGLYIQAFALSCEQAHIACVPWVYSYGPVQGSMEGIRQEARLHAQIMHELGLHTMMIDVEKEYKRVGAVTFAREYLKTLRSAGPDLTLGLLSYRFPHAQPEVPWDVLLPGVDFYAPQVYWVEAHNSAEQLRLSHMEYTTGLHKPYLPIGAS